MSWIVRVSITTPMVGGDPADEVLTLLEEFSSECGLSWSIVIDDVDAPNEYRDDMRHRRISPNLPPEYRTPLTSPPDQE